MKNSLIFALAKGGKFVLLVSRDAKANPFTEKDLKIKIGQLAQLVQSISFTPRGSGVRIPHCPPKLNPTRNSRIFL